MALSFISRAAAAANTVALPAFQAGDLAVVFAYRNASTTAPTVPATFTSVIADAGANTNSRAIGTRVLQSGDTSIGTWTNATAVQVVVLRGQKVTSPVATRSSGGTNTTTLTSPALTVTNTGGTAWLLFFGGSKATNANSPTLPGTTTISTSGNSIGALCCAYKSGNTANWSATNWSAAVGVAGNRMDTLEILAEPPPLPNSGAGTVSGTGSVTGGGTTAKRGSGAVSATGAVAGSGTAPRRGAGTANATATVTGAGTTARRGSGSLTATASVTGAGVKAARGSGPVAASGAIVGVGLAPSVPNLGAGTVAGTGMLAGVGMAARVGAGQFSASATLAGAGSSPNGGAGSLSAAGAVAGTGRQPDGGGSGLVAAAGALAGYGVTVRVAWGGIAAESQVDGDGAYPSQSGWGVGEVNAVGVLVGVGQRNVFRRFRSPGRLAPMKRSARR